MASGIPAENLPRLFEPFFTLVRIMERAWGWRFAIELFRTMAGIGSEENRDGATFQIFPCPCRCRETRIGWSGMEARSRWTSFHPPDSGTPAAWRGSLFPALFIASRGECLPNWIGSCGV